MYVDVSTQEGRDILKRYRNTPTISSSDPSRVTGERIVKKSNVKTATKVYNPKPNLFVDKSPKISNVSVHTGFGSEADKRITKKLRTSMLEGKKTNVSSKKEKLWRPFGSGTRPFTKQAEKYIKRFLKIGGGTIAAMLMAEEAGATSTLKTNPNTKDPEWDTKSKIRHTLTKNKMMPSNRKKK
jgi:hypothetical protein